MQSLSFGNWCGRIAQIIGADFIAALLGPDRFQHMIRLTDIAGPGSKRGYQVIILLVNQFHRLIRIGYHDRPMSIASEVCRPACCPQVIRNIDGIFVDLSVFDPSKQPFSALSNFTVVFWVNRRMY